MVRSSGPNRVQNQAETKSQLVPTERTRIQLSSGVTSAFALMAQQRRLGEEKEHGEAVDEKSPWSGLEPGIWPGKATCRAPQDEAAADAESIRMTDIGGKDKRAEKKKRRHLVRHGNNAENPAGKAGEREDLVPICNEAERLAPGRTNFGEQAQPLEVARAVTKVTTTGTAAAHHVQGKASLGGKKK